MSLRRGAPLGGHAGRADVGSAGPQGGPRSGPWPWVCRTAVCGSQALPAGRLVPVPRFLPGFSFFLSFFSQQRSSFEHFSCRPACPRPNVTARAPIQALLSCGLKSGEWGTELWVAVLGWGLSGAQQPHSPWQACLGLWSLSLFPVCSVTRSW